MNGHEPARVHPDKTAWRAVDACGGTFPRAKNDYDSGWQGGHEAALDAAIEAVRPVDDLMDDLLKALVEIADPTRTNPAFVRIQQIAREAIAKATEGAG